MSVRYNDAGFTAGAKEQLLDAGRCRRCHDRTSGQEPAEVVGMKAVCVLCRCHRVENRLLVDMQRERNLHEDAVDGIVCVELVD